MKAAAAAHRDSGSSDDERSTRETKQTGKNYVINLQSFHKTKLRIAELRNQETSNDIIDAYCSDGSPFCEVNPLLASDGGFPLVQSIYEHDTRGPLKTCWGSNCKLTELGKAFTADMEGDGAESLQRVQFGGELGGSLATATQMHLYPAKAWRAIERYFKARGQPTDICSRETWHKIRKHTKRWLRHAHLMYSTLVGRMSSDGLHLGEGIEMSHGPMFYSMLLQRFGHTHAQCLATLLQLITTLSLLNPDPKTGVEKTIMDFFDRAMRIARETKEFPAMNVPIADPLLKVMILQGLIRSNKAKYGQMVLSEYAQNLKSSFDQLRNTMQTVEGLREQSIIDQYAPTSLLTADVHSASGGMACSKPGHRGHTRQECDQPCRVPGHAGTRPASAGKQTGQANRQARARVQDPLSTEG
jgi:hypothetical protein